MQSCGRALLCLVSCSLLLPGCQPSPTASPEGVAKAPTVANKAAFHSSAAEFSPELEGLRFNELIDEVTRYYNNDRLDVIEKTRELMESLKPLGSVTSMKDMEIGAISLMRYSHDPNKGKHEYGDFCTQYLAWRKEGLTHQQTIAKLDELGKF